MDFSPVTNMVTKIFKSKTLMFSYALLIFGVVEMNFPLLRGSISGEAYGYMTIAIGIFTAVLRTVTTKPLDQK